MPRPSDVEIISQSHTFQLEPLSGSGRRVVRIIFVVTHDKPRQPSGPFTLDIPVEDFSAEKAWAELEKQAREYRAV
jgi:hypothetical protein